MKAIVLALLIILSSCHQGNKPVITIITSLFDINRGEFEYNKRPF